MSENSVPATSPNDATFGQPEDGQLPTSEHGEIVRQTARLNVRIDKAMLDSITITTPEPSESGIFRSTEDEQTEIDAKKSELEGVIDKFRRLPEELNFQPGITLIVGENGGGKSSLARAIFLVGKYHGRLKSSLEFHRTTDLPEYEQRTDEQLREKAYNDIFQPHSGTDAEELSMAGVGAYLAPAMLEGADFTSAHRAVYVDAGEAYGRAQTRTKERMQDTTMAVPKYGSRDLTTEIIQIKGEGSFGVKSTRQTVDSYLDDYKQMRSTSSTDVDTGSVEFIDEPETGLSPRRHQQIENEVYDVFGRPEEGNIIIVPTNSVVLFQSDLPRIDLDYPERGIHRPSEYPDHDGLVA